MKPLPIVLLVALSASAVGRTQGTVNFANVGAGLIAPVFEVDGATKLTGPRFWAQLFGGPTPNSLAALASTPFLSGNGSVQRYCHILNGKLVDLCPTISAHGRVPSYSSPLLRVNKG